MEVNPAQPEARAPGVMLLPVSATLAPHATGVRPRAGDWRVGPGQARLRCLSHVGLRRKNHSPKEISSMRSKMTAAIVSAVALALPATAMANVSPPGNAGSGGNGQAQLSSQQAETLQAAQSQAEANQNAVNANAPSNTA